VLAESYWLALGLGGFVVLSLLMLPAAWFAAGSTASRWRRQAGSAFVGCDCDRHGLWQCFLL